MKKFRKILLSALSLVLVVALTIVGTVAFLQDEDGEVNVMTVGNVYIEQLEQQFGANGLEEFVQKKNLYPVPDTTLDTEAFQSTVVPAPAVNVVDKLVSVNNYGKSDAFVRTVFAFEMGTLSVDQFKNVFVYRINNTDWTWEEIGVSNINGAKYFVVVATHNEIVEAKTTTDYSLTQVFLKSFAGNEECEAIDGNGNGTFDILTMSQAVQTVGFNDADTALNAAFGDVTNTQNPWTDGAEYRVSTLEQLKVAISVGGTVILEDNISLESALTVPEGIIATLDLNKYTISVPSGNAILNKGVLTLINGTVATDNGYAVNNAGSIVVSNANLTNLYNAGEATLNNTNIANTISGRHGVYHGGSALTVNGGVYSSTSGNELIRSNTSNAVINGGTFTQLGKSYLFHNVVINGGTFNGYVNDNGTVDAMRPGVVVNGGTFNFDPTSFAAHKELVVEGDNTWTVYPINDTWDGNFDTDWYKTGRAVAPEYKLYTAEQLAGLAKLVNEEGATFADSTIILMVNVDLQNKAWTPIGVSKGFVGTHPSARYATFDGNGKTVSNLNVDVKENAGLFGAATYAIIKNVNIKNATVVSNHFAGAVLAQGYARVENCTVENANVAVTPELIDGEWDNGDKVGGVVGKISESNNGSTIYGVYNCTIKNSTVKAYRDVAGILGFAGSYCYVQDNNVVNTTVSQDLTHDYKNFGAKNPSANVSAVVGDSTRQPGVTVKNNKVNGVETIVGSNELVENLENGKDVTFSEDVKINPAGMSNAYGTTGINVKNGQTIDGNGFVLDIKGAGGTWDSGISTTGGIIKNITVTGSFRGIFVNHNSDHSEKVILENVTIKGTTYTISCDQGTGKGLLATNSKFYGWTSYAGTLGEAEFVGCTFGKGNGYAFCRPYAPTTFVNCNFEAGYTLDPVAKVTLVNCTIDGVKITAKNVATLVTNVDNVKFPAEAENQAQVNEQIKTPGAVVALPEGNVTLSGIGAGATIIGSENTVVNSTVSGTLNNTTFVDVTIKAGNAQRWAYASGDLVFDGCTFDASSVYAIHYDGLTNATLVYRNCTIIGWAAIGSGAESVVFENCTIIGNGTYGLVRVYGDATFRNCTFDVVGKTNATDVYQDGIHSVGGNIVVENCTNVAGNIEDICHVSNGGNIIIR